jgi:type IV secretory pathway TrbD component
MLLYAGPDQVMAVASGLATAFGLLLMLWNKILTFGVKVVDSTKRLFQAKAASTPKSE